jgi:hypothetical protein
MLCERHAEDLARWLGKEEANRQAHEEEELVPLPLAMDYGLCTVLPKAALNMTNSGIASSGGGSSTGGGGGSGSHANGSGISILRHIGRMEPEMAFLSSLADDIIGRLARSRVNPLTRTVAQSLAQHFPHYQHHSRQPQQSVPPRGVKSPLADDARRSMQGKWEFCDKKDFEQFDRFLGAIGYPWFLRQFLGPAMSCQEITFTEAVQQPPDMDELFTPFSLASENLRTADAATLVVAACGKFLGYSLENINKRLPPMVFQCCLPDTSRPKYQLVDRASATSCVAKLSYRFVNTHVTVANEDGSFVSECINYNPRYFFSDAMKLTTVFDFEDMKLWMDHLHDVDPITGLPKTMSKEHWDRRMVEMTPTQRDGTTYMVYSLTVYEYDSATRCWDHLCCKTSVSFLRRE